SAVLNPNRRVWERTPWHVTRRGGGEAVGRDGTVMGLLLQERLAIPRTLRPPLAPLAPHQSPPGCLRGEAPREEAPAIQAPTPCAPGGAAARATGYHSRVPHATSGRRQTHRRDWPVGNGRPSTHDGWRQEDRGACYELTSPA